MPRKHNREASVVTLTAVLIVILLNGMSWPPGLAAQSLGRQVVGTPTFPARFIVVNFNDIAAREKRLPFLPREQESIHPPMPGPDEPAEPGSALLPDIIVERGPESLAPSPSFAAGFQALGDNNTRIPPDTMGAVGPAHLMVTSNSQFRIQDRNGGVISTVSTNMFWLSLGGNPSVFDPKILYDPFQNRWMITAVANSRSANSAILIAVSQSNDPTGNWILASFDADAQDLSWADFPSIGFNKDWIVVSVNMFTVSGNNFSGGQVYFFDKAGAYAGSIGAFVATGTPFTLVPARTYDDSLSTLYLVRHVSSAGGIIRKSTITGSPPSAPLLQLDTATVTSTLGPWSFSAGDFLPQAPPSGGGSARLIDVGDSRMQMAIVRTVGGTTSIWCAQTILLPSGGFPTRAAVQWWQLDSNPTSSTVLQQGRIEDSTATQTNGGSHFAYPSLAVNSDGNMLIGYSRFSSSAFATAAYSYRSKSDPANTTREDATLKSGVDNYEKTFTGASNRWGDYSSTMVDPVNDRDFWTIQEYAEAASGTGNGSGRWGLWWGKILPPPAVRLFFPLVRK